MANRRSSTPCTTAGNAPRGIIARMKTMLLRPIACLMIVFISVPQSFATCGGGGGGGRGGISPGGDQAQVYNVPWHVRTAAAPPVTDGLVVYWFPASTEE